VFHQRLIVQTLVLAPGIIVIDEPAEIFVSHPLYPQQWTFAYTVCMFAKGY
jgi:hypothetical protein